MEAQPEFLGNGDRLDREEATFFTPQRLVQIRSAQAEARLGQNISLEQHQAEMKQVRSKWKATNLTRGNS